MKITTNATDALSQALRAVRITGAAFAEHRLDGPWRWPGAPAGAGHTVIVHLLAEGEARLETDDGRLEPLAAGDAVLLARADAHRLDAVAPARLVTARLGCDARLARLLTAGLPAVLRVELRGSATGAWLAAALAAAPEAADGPGGEVVCERLAELVFVELLRRCVNDPNAEARTGWLAGWRDRSVGAALQALHQRPAQAWTLDALARAAGSSRSVLAERFQRIVGCAPMQYLTQWRLAAAAELLCRGTVPLTQVANDVGYQTDTAFNRAFRRAYGLPPAAWRRHRQGSPAAYQSTPQ